MRNFIKAIIYGAGSALGAVMVTGLVEDLKNPVKKAEIQKLISNIKNKVFKKKES